MRFQIREKLLALGNDASVTDEQGNIIYVADGKALSLRSRVEVKDTQGQIVGVIHRKLMALRPTFVVEIPGRETIEIRRKLFAFRDKFTIDLPGDEDWTLRGNLLDHDFVLTSGDRTIATISKKWISLADTFGVEVADGEDHLLVLMTVLALEAVEDDEGAAASAAIAGGVVSASS